MRKRDLSRREREIIQETIRRVCRAMEIREDDPDLFQAAWTAILSVYREDPQGFAGSHSRGWRRAYRLAWDAISQEQKARWPLLFQTRSLDKPLCRDTKTTLLQLLHSPCGSFENSVGFHDFLERLPPDLQRAARGLMEGDTLAQLRGCYHWDWDHTYRTFNQLRAEMEHYVRL